MEAAVSRVELLPRRNWHSLFELPFLLLCASCCAAPAVRTHHRFVRVPGEYYDQPLEFRRSCLKAASTDHLCKSIIMENTKAHPSVDGWSDPNNSKYYVVILQVRPLSRATCPHSS